MEEVITNYYRNLLDKAWVSASKAPKGRNAQNHLKSRFYCPLLWRGEMENRVKPLKSAKPDFLSLFKAFGW